MNAVSLQGVGKRYRDFEAVADVSLEIPEGRLIALIGHNGAGKTTLLKMILGITRPSAGDIRLWNEPQRDGGDARPDRIGFLPEVFNFNDAMTGAEALRFLARLKRQSPGQCAELLHQVGLADAAERRIKTYSKGMRQRLGLAQALLGRPRLLLLDEPTTGLDPDLRRDFYRIIGERREQGVTVIVSTHSLHEIEHHADRMVILRESRLVANGPLDALCQGIGIGMRIEVEARTAAARAALESALTGFSYRVVDDRRLAVECSKTDKLDLLRRLLEDTSDLADIHIHSPRLDDVYRHYMDGMES